MQYTVHGLDVWGNEHDGFDVNDVYPSHATVELAEGDTDAQIIRKLVDCGSLTSTRFHFVIDGEMEFGLYVNHEPTGRPLLELRPVK